VYMAKMKAIDINKKLSVIDMDQKVYMAKMKAIDINKKLSVIENKSWKTIKRRKVVNKEINNHTKIKTTIIRVRKADAEIALLGAMRNGLNNFSIEYTDDHSN
jgi:hypothetical protein